jgi:hypothetical protein|uniref:Uncharacterized protein n=1 Tax=viral metagenome TaxID=1070528 RepID=A0A6C0C3M4_9ZZZZ
MTKRHTKESDGKYHIDGKKFDQLVGSRAQVFHGTAYKTSSSAVKPKGDALAKKHLKKNKHHRIVSVEKSNKGPMMLKRLHNKGYFTRKGHFGAIKKPVKSHKKRKTHKGNKRTGKHVSKRSGLKRVTIREKRNRSTGRFSKGGN